jgi:hypothetical protein
MQYLKLRVGQHKSAMNTGNCGHSAFSEHAISNKHNIDWSNYSILVKIASENRLKNRQNLEMI